MIAFKNGEVEISKDGNNYHVWFHSIKYGSQKIPYKSQTAFASEKDAKECLNHFINS